MKTQEASSCGASATYVHAHFDGGSFVDEQHICSEHFLTRSCAFTCIITGLRRKRGQIWNLPGCIRALSPKVKNNKHVIKDFSKKANFNLASGGGDKFYYTRQVHKQLFKTFKASGGGKR